MTQAITEKDKAILDQWRKEAKEQTLETLPAWLKHLSEDYEHDYGTICHAIALAAYAAARAVDAGSQGGITGFQAGAVMWEFMRIWNGIEGPARLLQYENMLYPQYEDRYNKTISKSTWEWLQKEAKKKLTDVAEARLAGRSEPSPTIIDHWQTILDGKIPFGYTVED
jgi:hypothetical protein